MKFNDEFGYYEMTSSPEGDAPFFSIVMAVKDGLEFLKEAVNSILGQSESSWELVLIDDGSNEDTATYLRNLAAKESRVRLLVQNNIGLTKSLIRGVRVARGEFIVRHDGDDVSLPDRLTIIRQNIEIHHADIFFGRALVFGGPNERIAPISVLPLGVTRSLLRFGNIFVHGSFCARRSILQQMNYDPEHRYAQDYDLFIRLLMTKARVVYIMRPLYQLRESVNSISQEKFKEQLDCARSIVRQHFGDDSWLIAGASGPRRRALQILCLGLYMFRALLGVRRVIIA